MIMSSLHRHRGFLKQSANLKSQRSDVALQSSSYTRLEFCALSAENFWNFEVRKAI